MNSFKYKPETFWEMQVICMLGSYNFCYLVLKSPVYYTSSWYSPPGNLFNKCIELSLLGNDFVVNWMLPLTDSYKLPFSTGLFFCLS